MRVRLLFTLLALGAVSATGLATAPESAAAETAPSAPSELDRRLETGEIVVKMAKSAPTVYEFDVYGYVDAPQDAVWSAITSYDRYTEFLPMVTDSEVRSRAGGKVNQYVRMAQVWPFPRQWVLNACVENRAAGVLSWTMVEGTPRKQGGYWQILPRGERTRLRYHLSVDPWMDQAPDWLVKMVTKVTLPDVIKGVRRRATAVASR